MIAPDLRITFTLENGLQVWAFACECYTCKNFFFMPRAEVDELPNFCPFCGTKFNHDTIERDANLEGEMRKVLDVVSQGDSP